AAALALGDGTDLPREGNDEQDFQHGGPFGRGVLAALTKSLVNGGETARGAEHLPTRGPADLAPALIVIPARDVLTGVKNQQPKLFAKTGPVLGRVVGRPSPDQGLDPSVPFCFQVHGPTL